MFKQLIAAAILAAFATSGAWAQDKKAAAKKPAQQTKMKKCNADAKGMKGDERKKFMSTCLKG